MGFCNTSKDIEYIQKQVVIPTHMWASATAGMQAVEDVSKVVIPTHMWASATYYKNIGGYWVKLLYPLICGLLQR